MSGGPGWLRLRKYLYGQAHDCVWPRGITPAPLAAIDPRGAHAVLDIAFPGRIARFDDWHGNLTADSEYDPALCIAAVTETDEVVGFAQCWTSNFVKDLAVAPPFRGRGIALALMGHVFQLFAARGAPFVDLKVGTDERHARRLYARLGMVEVDPQGS